MLFYILIFRVKQLIKKKVTTINTVAAWKKLTFKVRILFLSHSSKITLRSRKHLINILPEFYKIVYGHLLGTKNSRFLLHRDVGKSHHSYSIVNVDFYRCSDPKIFRLLPPIGPNDIYLTFLLGIFMCFIEISPKIECRFYVGLHRWII